MLLFSRSQGETRRKRVGLLLNKEGKKFLTECSTMNERIIIATFGSKHSEKTIFQCYAPSDAKDNKKIDLCHTLHEYQEI